MTLVGTLRNRTIMAKEINNTTSENHTIMFNQCECTALYLFFYQILPALKFLGVWEYNPIYVIS